MKKVVMILCLLAVTTSWAVAGEQPSIARGKELFNGKQLGTNSKSCASCHPDGNNMNKAAGYKESKLAGIINQCIKMPLKGNPLAANSTDLKSLIMYIKSLAPQAKM